MTTVINDDACIRSLGSGSAIGTGDGTRRIVRYTADATLKLADAGCIIEIDSPTPVNITVPSFASVPYKSAVYFDFVQIGVGSVTVVAAAGVTLETNGLVMSAKDSTAFLYRRDTVNDFVFSNAPPADWVTLSNRPANLVALGGLTGAINTFPAFSGVGAMIVKAISDFGYSLVAAANAAAVKVLLGLDLVSNTSDANKPVSTATQAALDGKVSDVTNGTGTGATFVTTPSAGVREVARLVGANTDIVVTQGAAGAPNTIGLTGTTLKYWEEVSTAIDASTQRLVWRPKDPNGTFVRANSLLGIAVMRAFNLEDPLDAAYSSNFTEGLNLQIKPNTYSQASTQGFAFGTNNQVANFCTAIGSSNRATAVTGTVAYTSSNMVAGYNNNMANQGYTFVYGMLNTNTGGAYRNNTFGQNNTNSAIYGLAIGEGNAASGSNGISVGYTNTAGNYGICLGGQNVASGNTMGLAIGKLNNVSISQGGDPDPIAVGKSNTLSRGGIALGRSNDGGLSSILIGDSNSGNGIRIGESNTGSTGGMALGSSNTLAGNATVIGNTNLVTATLTPSLIIGNNMRDNGLRNFSVVGNKAMVVFKNPGLDTRALWTSTAWSDITNGVLLSATNAVEQTKFTASVDIRFTNNALGAVALTTARKAIVLLEGWTRDDGTFVLTKKLVEAGDSDIFTYINLQMITTETGVKLQWQYASNPASSQTQSTPGTQDGVSVNLYMAGIIEGLITRT